PFRACISAPRLHRPHKVCDGTHVDKQNHPTPTPHALRYERFRRDERRNEPNTSSRAHDGRGLIWACVHLFTRIYSHLGSPRVPPPFPPGPGAPVDDSRTIRSPRENKMMKIIAAAVVPISLALSACDQSSQTQAAPPPPPKVTIAKPVIRTIADHD